MSNEVSVTPDSIRRSGNQRKEAKKPGIPREAGHDGNRFLAATGLIQQHWRVAGLFSVPQEVAVSIFHANKGGSVVMTKRKQPGATWSAVKALVSEMDHKQLVKLLADLYRLSKENQNFFHARFAIGEDPLGPYKKTIKDCMYPDWRTNKPIRISKAKGAIGSYVKAIGDPLGEADLMTYFVECGNRFTVEFGDIDEDFYCSLNLMYRRVIDKVLSLPEEHREDFRERLSEIMESSGNIGWGYHDALCADYSEAFPDDEDYDENSPDDHSE